MKKKYFLSLVAPVHLEDDFLIEFIEYYLIQGVEHFYFYDNDNIVPLSVTLKKYLDLCTINVFEGLYAQTRAYEHWSRNYKDETEWIAVFDIDEFVLPKKHVSLVHFLHELPKSVSAVGINWVIFGNGGHVSKPNGFVIENYIFNEGKQHENYKTVSRTKDIKKLHHPHRPILKWFKSVRNPKLSKIIGYQSNENTIDIIQLNHYYTKSENEFKDKWYRRMGDSGNSRISIKENHKWMFDEHIRTSVNKETLIYDKYGDQLKKNLQNRK